MGYPLKRFCKSAETDPGFNSIPMPQLPEQSSTPFLVLLKGIPLFFAYIELPNMVFMITIRTEGRRHMHLPYQKVSFHLIMKSLTSDPGVKED